MTRRQKCANWARRMKDIRREVAANRRGLAYFEALGWPRVVWATPPQSIGEWFMRMGGVADIGPSGTIERVEIDHVAICRAAERGQPS